MSTVQAIYGKTPIGATGKLSGVRGVGLSEKESRDRMAGQVAELEEMEKAGLVEIIDRLCAPDSDDVQTVVYKRLK
jgi:hypothetical protein